MSFLYILALNAVFLLIITIIAFLNARRSKLILDVFFVCVCGFFWGISLSLIFLSASNIGLSVWSRIHNGFFIILAAVILNFILGFTDEKEYLKKIIVGICVVAGLLLLYNFSPFYVPKLQYVRVASASSNHPFYIILSIFHLSVIIFAISRLILFRFRNPEKLRIPINYIIVGIFIAILIIVNQNLWMSGIISVPWLSSLMFLSYFLMLYAVMRRELPGMEGVEISIIVNVVIGITLTGFLYFIILLMEVWVIDEIDWRVILPIFLGSFLLLLFLTPLKDKVERIVHSLFYPEIDKQKKVSLDFSKEIVRIMNRQDLFNYMINTTGFLLFIKKAAIYVLNNDVQKFMPDTMVGIKNPDKLKLKKQSNFIRYLEKRKNYVFWEKINEDYRLIRIKEELEESASEGITLWYPLISRGMILAIFGVGPKMTGDYFSSKDMEMLSNLISGATIALENIELYELTQKLRELDEMKKDFVSNVTHELKSPLTAIQSCVDYLLKKRAGELSRGQMDYLVIIQNNAARLTRFISALLDIARIESAKLDLYFEETNLTTIAQEIVMLFSPYANEKGIEIHLISQPDLPFISVDQDKIKQILTNLLSNSIKFTDYGEILLRIEEESQYIRMEVSDNGVGIPKEALDKLFNKFYQVRETHRLKHYGGTGLGLAIVKGIVEAHGGSIGVESEQGKGSTFIIKLPKLRGHAA
ncbi:MAG: ATP-binding protein [bacterium]